MRCVVPSLLLIAAAAVAEDTPTTILGFTADGTTAGAPVRGPAWGSGPAAPVLIIVTADRQDMPRDRTTATVGVVTEDDLRNQGHPSSILDAVRGLPGLDAPGAAGFLGTSANLRLRGTGGGDTAILVDGIPLLDASTINGHSPFGSVDPTGLRQVEIVAGPQSGLYGSGAIGGVINIITLRPTDRAMTSLRGEAGSFGTVASEAQATGPLSRRVGYALAVGGLRTDGFSSHTDKFGRPGNNEADGAERSSGSARIEVTPIDQLSVYTAIRGESLNEELDNTSPKDRDSGLQTRRVRAAAGGQLDLGYGGLAFDLARTSTLRRYEYDDNYDFVDNTYLYRGTDDYASLRATGVVLSPGRSRTAFDRASVTIGSDITRTHAETSTMDDGDRLVGLWGQVLLGGKQWEFSQTARRDTHSRDGGAGTWRSGAAVFLADQAVKIHGSAGTAFRAPSTYQLYEPASVSVWGTFPIGNQSLKPVRSFGADLGHISQIPGDVTLEQTVFRTVYQQDIGYGNGYENTGGYRVEGLENAVRLRDGLPGLRLRVSYTTQRTDLSEDEIVNTAAFGYLPRHKGSIEPAYHASRAWVALRLTMNGRTVGPFYDDFGSRVTHESAGYAVLSASAGYRPIKGWEVYARGENLGNTAYETYPGNSTSPLAGYGGVSAEF